ncbi:hypothetical protein SDC9_127972 [bioreactor metagenome]|uniref:2-dehydropantoate 2-reductase n=1 Tax=bioreactor metagenome TaxID=1076179 RepID=A0A645CVI4_9ZZZZ
MILVKYSALSEASELIGPCVGEDTIILSLLNGIDSEEILRESFGEKRIPRSFIQGGAVKEGRNISFTSMGKIMYGYDGLSKEENRQNENIDALEEFFNRCGIPNRVSFDIVYEQWYKFMSNISMNIPSAILLAPYGVFMENQRLVALVEEICFEVIAVANRCGVPLSCNDVKRLISIFPGMQADGKSSTMQDVEAKRKTEVDMFCQTIVNLGKKHGVLTPYNRMMLDFVKIKEDMHGM